MEGTIVESSIKILLRKFLVIVLLAGFVFSGWGIFATQITNAIEPPGPSTASITYAFTSPEHGGVMMKYRPGTGDEVSFDFVTAGQLVAPGTTVEGSVENNVLGAINTAGVTTTGYFWKYSSSANPGFFLLIGMKVQNAGDPARPIGQYYSLGVGKMNGSRFGYELGFKTPDGTDISNTINTAVRSTPARIHWTIDTNNACNQLVARWEGMAANMRDILIKQPKDNPEYWDRAEPKGWRKALNIGAFNSALTAASATNPSLGGLAAIANMFPNGVNSFVGRLQGYDMGYYLNDAGMRKASDIRSEAVELKAITEQLKGTSGANEWPTTPPGCRPKALDGDTLTLIPDKFIATPDDFINGLGVFIQAFNEAVANASGEDEEDTCGNGLNKVAVIFQWMFCKVAEMIHGISNHVMKSAFGWLTLSLGTEIVQFSAPALDASINNIATSSTGMPSTGGGTTPAPTPTPIHLYAKITFTRQSSYNATKSSQGRLVSKIGPKGPNDRPAETGSFAGTIEFISFNDTAKVVNVKINANQALPAGQTVVSILGYEPVSAGSSTSGQEAFLFIANATDFGNTAAAPKLYTSIL